MASVLILSFAAAFGPAAVAQAPTCDVQDFNDPGADTARNPANVNQADQVTGLDRADLRGGCLAETATDLQVFITIARAGPAGPQQRAEFTLNFKNAAGAAQTEVLTDAGGTLTRSPPGRTHAYASGGVLFIIPKDAIGAAAGAVLSDFFITSSARFVDVAGNVVTAADRAPDGTAVLFPAASSPYRSGQRAPTTVDSDMDGVPDRQEIANGTDPASADSDHDGLLDGPSRTVTAGSPEAQNMTEAGIYQVSTQGDQITFGGEDAYGTNSTLPDTDGDGLLDGGNVRTPTGGNVSTYFANHSLVPISSDGSEDLFLGELGYGSDPVLPDSDADGLLDREEVTGSANGAHSDHGFFPEFPGSSDPNNADTDGDGLSDADEVGGAATGPNGERATFAPLDPNDEDTDLDGLTDYEEVFGRADVDGREVVFTPTDPTSADTDGDGVTDYDEVRQNASPNDPGDSPGQDDQPGGAEASYLVLSTIAMLVVILLCVIGIMVRWG